MSERLSEIIDNVFKELDNNKTSISEKLQKNIEVLRHVRHFVNQEAHAQPLL